MNSPARKREFITVTEARMPTMRFYTAVFIAVMFAAESLVRLPPARRRGLEVGGTEPDPRVGGQDDQRPRASRKRRRLSRTRVELVESTEVAV